MKKPFKTSIPFDKMYQASRKEASRKKPVFFIHKYFARRITANFRLALLAFDSEENEDIYKSFYEPSINSKRSSYTILDPFMGGGTTIFEALRFGHNVIGCDLQPLSLFVTKALVEPINETAVKKAVNELDKTVGKRIKSYYQTQCPKCGEKADSMYAFHVKTVNGSSKCKKHKLFTSFILAYKKDEFTVVCPICGEISKTKFNENGFTCSCGWHLNSPKDGYVKNGIFTCEKCNEKKSLSDYTAKDGYPYSTDIIAIEYCCPHCGAHDYKKPSKDDINLYHSACAELKVLEQSLPIPQQSIPTGYNTNQIINHGYTKFKDLFNSRQLLCLGLLLDAINNIKDENTQLWLQLAFSGMLEMNNMFCRYQQNAYKICNIFFNHAYVPIAMPVENCVWGAKLGTGTFIKTIRKIIRGKNFNSNIYDLSAQKNNSGKFDSIQIASSDKVIAYPVNSCDTMDASHPVLKCADSRNLNFIPDNSVDFVLTDPPYGANVMYSELIDFFHVWNYNSSLAIKNGFSTPLTPKSSEIIVNSIAGKDFNYYQDGIESVWKQCFNKLKKDGYLVFSFHDKNISSWLAILDSIYHAGFKLTKCFPVQAETRTGAHTSGKNSIGIDIMLVCKKATTRADTNLSPNTVERALIHTKSILFKTLEKLQSVEAEITIPDIQNITIAQFFTDFPEYFSSDTNYKESALSALSNFLNNLDQFSSDFEIVKKRNGWWSEFYKEKWDI